MTIGERIRNRRIELNMSQDELAHKLGYKSRSSINKIELNGRNLTQSKIKAIATALETTPSYIMGWSNDDIEFYNNSVDRTIRSIAKEFDRQYYTNQETADMAQELFDNEDMRILFDAARGSDPDDLRMAADFLKRLKNKERGEN